MANNSSTFFPLPMYVGDDWVPSGFEYGVLEQVRESWVEVFINSGMS